MRSFTREQWITFGAAAVLIVLLFLVPIVPQSDKKSEPVSEKNSEIIADYVKASRQRMKPQALSQLSSIEDKIKNTTDPELRNKLWDSASAVASRNGEYILASWLYEERAIATGKVARHWQLAGQGFQAVAGFTEQENIRFPLQQEAYKCLSKAAEIDPKDISIQVDLGIAVVSLGQEPMRGVGILKNVVQVDSTNFNAMVALGNFSVQSGQHDKAIDWYERAVKAHPENFWLLRQIAMVYEMKGDRTRQKECLNKYLELETDSTLRKEVEHQITQLSKTN